MAARTIKKIITEDDFEPLQYIAGADIAYTLDDEKLIAGIAVLDAQTLTIVEEVTVEAAPTFPYIPGLFSFREMPALEAAFAQLTIRPQLIVFDGQGRAHPRRFGLACHFGLLHDIPTIGCGKTRLHGDYKLPEPQRGRYSQLTDNEEVIGNVLRTQDDVKPVFVSIGHRVSLPKARQIILHLSPKYRLPETTRAADQLVNRKRKELNEI